VANTGISGSDIRDIMLEAVERRFKALRAPATIEMLTDNGPLYIAKDNPDLRPSARQPCFRPDSVPRDGVGAPTFGEVRA
jgi:putative transposase